MIRSLGIALIIVVCSACSARQENVFSESKAPAAEERVMSPELEADAYKREEMATEALTSLAARAVKFDSLHKFVKTANLRFRTENVIKASLDIEKLVFENAGFVEFSELRSEEKDIRVIPGNDKEIRKYTTVSTITLRVPEEKLNDFLMKLQPFVEYLDLRNVTATNVAFDQYLKKLIQNRISAHSLRLLNGKNKAADLDQLLAREMESDKEMIEEMRLDEQVAYSTVRLEIYGPDKLNIINTPAFDLTDYEPGFGSKFMSALSFGWSMIVALFMLLISIWPVILLLAVLWIILKRRAVNKKTDFPKEDPL